MEPAQRLLIWEMESGSTYKRKMDQFLIDIFDGTTQLTAGTSSTLNAGEWFYDLESGFAYVRMSDDSNPNTKSILGIYRLFYSNAPLDLPFDLLSGGDVHYEGALSSNSPITKQLDSEQIGVALESSTNISFNNTSGLFDGIYDTLFFENKRVRLFSWNPNILLTEKQLLFDGIIEDKTFSVKNVGFKCKDFVFKLREPLTMELFSSIDGNITDSNLNKPKRRIYGRADNVQCIGIDNILGGFDLSGTLTGEFGTNTITGTGTAFLDECSPSDKIIVIVNNETFEFNIESVDSDTQLTMSDELDSDLLNIPAKNDPVRPWRKKNRRWHVSGNRLRSPNTTVATALQANRFSLADGSDIFPNDVINVDGENAIVKRISNGNVTLKANLQLGTPSIGAIVTKTPLSNAYFGKNEIFIERDWIVLNGTDTILELTETVERDLAKSKGIDGVLTFTNGSRTVTSSGVDLVNELKPRDWINSSVNHSVFYEILSVTETSLELRIPFAGATETGSTAQKKNTDLIFDDSLMTVNCIGMESNNKWIKTASDAVLNLLESDALLTTIDYDSFSQSDDGAPYVLSMVIPAEIGGTVPKIRDVITQINESVFGSLVNNNEWNMVYNVLTPEKPESLSMLSDDDIIGEISVKSRNKIVRKVNAQYRPFVDRFSGVDSFKLIQIENDFVDQFIGAKSEKNIKLFIYGDNDAIEIAERYALYNSLAQSVVTMKGKINFMLLNLNDKIFINLDRLFRRLGGRDRKKIGIISKITKNGSNTSLEFNDLGNVFNRVLSIAPDSANDFTIATDNEKLINSYILDDDLEIPETSNDDFWGTGLIG